MSQINWFKNEVPVTDVGYLTTPLKVNSSMTLSESTLTFLNVLKTDRANYSCYICIYIKCILTFYLYIQKITLGTKSYVI